MHAFRSPLVVMAATLALSWATSASAQVVGPQRNCQTVLTCNFTKGGSYRGCLSSYSCRQCAFVSVRCRGGRGRVCREMRCDWGAGV